MRKQISNGRHVLTAAGRIAVCEAIASCGGCTGTVPTQMQVAIALIATLTCTDCTIANGTHILDHDPSLSTGAGPCGYSKVLGDMGGGGNCNGLSIRAFMDPTLGAISVTIAKTDLSAILFRWLLSTTVPLDCTTISALNLPRDGVTWSGLLCDPSTSTCLITAL